MRTLKDALNEHKDRFKGAQVELPKTQIRSRTVEEQMEAIRRIRAKDKPAKGRLVVPFYKFKFGKYKGHTLKDVYEKDKNYLAWMVNNFERVDEVIYNFVHDWVI